MHLKITAENILGRNLFPQEGMKESSIIEQEKRLKIEIPLVLKEFYSTLGNNILFKDGFNHFAEMTELFIKDNKLVFLQENQSVVYWAVDLTNTKKVYQTTDQNFDKNVEWFEEELDLAEFIEMLLYFQCVMSDENNHHKAQSGFQYFASLDIVEYQRNKKSRIFIDNLNNDFSKVVNENGLAIYWKPETIIMYFLNHGNKINDMILTCTKSETVLDKLIDEYGFGEL